MVQALVSGKLDAALVLTEAVAHAVNQNLAIVPLAVFVESPLVWGIFSGAQNPILQVNPQEFPRYAISRLGSGSHLMAQLDSFIRGGKIAPEQFVPVGNLEGASQSLQNQETDLFFWEKWMTKPLVDRGLLKMIDERPTPWSCFLLVVGKELSQNVLQLDRLKAAYKQVLDMACQFHKEPKANRQLADSYGLHPNDARAWLQTVKWAETWIDPKTQLQMAEGWLREISGV